MALRRIWRHVNHTPLANMRGPVGACAVRFEGHVPGADAMLSRTMITRGSWLFGNPELVLVFSCFSISVLPISFQMFLSRSPCCIHETIRLEITVVCASYQKPRCLFERAPECTRIYSTRAEHIGSNWVLCDVRKVQMTKAPTPLRGHLTTHILYAP